jgi:hypothetical protein
VFLADNAGAHWVLDEIAISQTRPKVKAEEFQVWTLKVDLEKRKAVLAINTYRGGTADYLVGAECHFHRLFSLIRRANPLPPANRIHGGVGQDCRATPYCYSFYGAVRGNDGFHLHDAAELQVASQLGIRRRDASNDFAHTSGLILLSKAGKGQTEHDPS